jgi:hypothetical protein
MKKLIFISVLLAVLFITTDTYAQGFGVKGSFDMFNMTLKSSNGTKTDTKMIPKFDAGVFAEIPIVDEFFLRPELLYVTKGTKMTSSSTNPTMNLSYLELPVLFLYKGALSNGKVLLGFGPYAAMGIGGKYKYGTTEYTVKFKNDVTTSEASTTYLKPLDIGAMIMLGYEMAGGLSLALNTSMGLTNIEPKYNGEKPDGTIKNVGFGLTLGYRFGGN